VDILYSLIFHENKPGARIRKYNIVYMDGIYINKDFDTDLMLFEFERDLRVTVGLLSPLYVFVHAGVVSWNGHLIVLPADGMAGKSSLVKALVGAGALYYSDEIALIDPDGKVNAYSRPMTTREPGYGRSKRRITAEELGSQDGTEPLPISMVLYTSYKEGATWRPRKMNLRQGIMGMFNQTFSAHRQTERDLNWIKNALGSAELLQSPRGEAEQIVNYLRHHLGDPKAD
jgi:hypothetical protein